MTRIFSNTTVKLVWLSRQEENMNRSFWDERSAKTMSSVFLIWASLLPWRYEWKYFYHRGHDLVCVPFLSCLCWSLTFILHENYIISIISLLLSCPFFYQVVKIDFLILKSVTMSDKVNTFINASCSGLRKLFLYRPYIIIHIFIIYKC